MSCNANSHNYFHIFKEINGIKSKKNFHVSYLNNANEARNFRSNLNYKILTVVKFNLNK